MYTLSNEQRRGLSTEILLKDTQIGICYPSLVHMERVESLQACEGGNMNCLSFYRYQYSFGNLFSINSDELLHNILSSTIKAKTAHE